jgi:hypothetical protein
VSTKLANAGSFPDAEVVDVVLDAVLDAVVLLPESAVQAKMTVQVANVAVSRATVKLQLIARCGGS